MKVADFNFDLPEQLIAKYPPAQRGDSRLLSLDGQTGKLEHGTFHNILELIQPEDLLVFNDTRVVPARMFARKETGGKLEILFERKLDQQRFLAHVRASKSPKPGSRLILESGLELTMQSRAGALFELQVPDDREVFEVLEASGHMPLPPYIDRQDENLDADRYQTVFAKKPGAAAAPTAGLHFDDHLMQRLTDKGVSFAFVTLHVGAGTFQPVKVEEIKDHVMHSEWIDVPAKVVEQIAQTKAKGGRVIAVGTTSCRSLESASADGALRAFTGDTDIFIYPGCHFHTVDALITNFHLPQSTLLMLVSAFSGQANVMNAYNEAIQQGYRFFSYGDAMFLTPQDAALRPDTDTDLSMHANGRPD